MYGGRKEGWKPLKACGQAGNQKTGVQGKVQGSYITKIDPPPLPKRPKPTPTRLWGKAGRAAGGRQGRAAGSQLNSQCFLHPEFYIRRYAYIEDSPT